MSERTTVQVRIAVVINEAGGWNAYGGKGVGDDAAVTIATDGLDEVGHDWVVFVEASVPLPVRAVVEGKVVEGK